MLSRGEIRWPTRPLNDIPFLCLEKLLGLFSQYVLGQYPSVLWNGTLSVKAKIIHNASFQIHCGGVKRQNYKSCATVPIRMHLTVCFMQLAAGWRHVVTEKPSLHSELFAWMCLYLTWRTGAWLFTPFRTIVTSRTHITMGLMQRRITRKWGWRCGSSCNR